jgi:predicted transcriptional regulator with HTH domain
VEMVRLRRRIIALLWRIYIYIIYNNGIHEIDVLRDAFTVSPHGGSSNEHYSGSNSFLKDSPVLVRR